MRVRWRWLSAASRTGTEKPAMTAPHEFVIHIDNATFKVDKTSMTGIEIKALAGRDASYQLFRERKGSDPDQLVGDNDTIQFEHGEHFYTVPQATFG